jgi:hypothetical protein
MARTNRIALFASLALIVALAGTVLATRAPQTADDPAPLAASHEAEPENEAQGDEDDGTTVAIERLADAGIEVEDVAVFEDLAARYGQGGAIRLYAWAHATNDEYSVAQIAEMRDGDGEPVGWGRLAKRLGVHPGIGSIMGGGNAPDGPPGQQNRGDRDDSDD